MERALIHLKTPPFLLCGRFFVFAIRAPPVIHLDCSAKFSIRLVLSLFLLGPQ